ncbi:glycosyltransferase [Aestuariimicrobium sp. Y1814]|uniref:glycosyltransferase n=1 Tax=Aestuariimicrobium sp. Y1814 TaxID=3418742 RepID=UPI003DA722AA
MKITVVSMHTSPWTQLGSGDGGGMNVVVRHTSEELAALGHQVQVVTRRTDPDTPEHQQMAPGVDLVTLTAGPQAHLAKSRIDEHIDEFRTGLAGLAPGDIVHSHHWMSGVAAMPVAEQWGVPHVMSFHSIAAPQLHVDLGLGEPPESGRRVPGELLCARGSDRIVAVSHAEARTVVERFGIDAGRVTVVAPGVDHDLFRPLAPGEPTLERRGADDDFLLFAARLQPLKGADLVVEALGHLEPAHRPRLVIAGEVSEDFADYQGVIDEIIARHDLAEWVSYAGARPRDGFAALVREASLMVIPSHSETFGLVALESAASGVPVVASAAGGLVESVAEGRSGRLVARRDPELWAATITDLLTDREALTALGRSAHEWSLDFSWAESARRLEQVLTDLL